MKNLVDQRFTCTSKFNRWSNVYRLCSRILQLLYRWPLLTVLLIGWLIVPSPILSQTTGGDFQAFENLFIQFRANQGKWLFPDIYQKFYPYIQNNGEQWQTLPAEKQQQLIQDLQTWVERSQKAAQFLETVFSLRDAALRAGAEDFAEEIFARAESALQRAADLWIQGKTKKAREERDRASKLYQDAEREAIRNNLLGQAQILIQESIDLNARKLTPRSLALTQQLLQEVERLIEQQSPHSAELSLKNEQLAEAAQHLLFLTQLLNRLYENPDQAEAYFLQLEERLKQLAESAGYTPSFTRDYSEIVQEITQAVQNLNQKISQLQERIQELQQENQQLLERLKRHQSREEQLARLQAKVDKIRQIFQGTSVQVTADTHRIGIRINGIAFAPGSATIPPRDYALLNRLARAIQEFPLNVYRIEIIQTTTGNVKYYENLARLRAKAVQAYLQAILPIRDQQFEIVGQAIENGPSPTNKTILQFYILLERPQG
ncbi:MAG: OmpA family protein [Calditrichaeota bacterium]|nr:OmpA family protein [Calditrichota bacterium]